MSQTKKKEKIINAFLYELSENGYAKLNTNKICERAGVSKGLLFHHYKSKNNLFITVSKNFLNMLYDYLVSFDVSNLDFYTAINTYTQDKLHFFTENPQYIKLFTMLFFDLPKEFSDALNHNIQQVTTVFRDKIFVLLEKLNLNNNVNIIYVVDLIFAIHYLIGKKHKTNALENKLKENIIEDMINDFTNYFNIILKGIIA